MRQQLDTDIRSTVARVVGEDLSQVDADTDLVAEIGMDSLQSLRALAAIEKQFGVRFPDDSLGEFRTLRQLADVINSQR